MTAGEGLRRGDRFIATGGVHRGTIVEILSASSGNVRFWLVGQHRRTDSNRWHGLRRSAFERFFAPY